MGQQLSLIGGQNLYAVHEHEASLNKADYGYLSSRVEKFIKLAQSSLAARVRDRYSGDCNPQMQLLQKSLPVTSADEVPAASHNSCPLRHGDISAIDLSFHTDECAMGVSVSDVLLDPVSLCCHVPVKKLLKVDTTDIGCQSVDPSSCCTASELGNISSQILEEASFKESNDFHSAYDKVSVNEINEILPCGHECIAGGKLHCGDTEGHCRSRPPLSPMFITTAATVLQSACETWPTEIGSYLAVTPVVSSCDLGLSPVDEADEVVMTSAVLQCHVGTADKPGCHMTSFHNDCTKMLFSRDVHDSISSDRSAACLIVGGTDIINNTTTLQPKELFTKVESNVSDDFSRAKNEVIDFDNRCHCHVNSCYSSLISRSGETDKCQLKSARNTVELVTCSSSSVLPSKNAVLMHSSRAMKDGAEVTDCCVQMSACSSVDDCNQLADSNPVAAASCATCPLHNDSFCSLHSSIASSVIADVTDLSNNKDLHSSVSKIKDRDTGCVHCMSETKNCTEMSSLTDVDTSSFDSVWEVAFPCCDWSSNNNQSTSPVAARMKMSPIAGPMIAHRQVRHSSEGSSQYSSSLSSTGGHLSASGGQLQPLASRSSSQASLDDAIVSPYAIPERLDFLQLEKFEGRLSVKKLADVVTPVLVRLLALISLVKKFQHCYLCILKELCVVDIGLFKWICRCSAGSTEVNNVISCDLEAY